MPQKRFSVILCVVGLALGLVGTVALWSAPLADRAVAVSPGDSSKLALVEARCPTFSWGAVPGAESYELVVYRLGDEGATEEPVLRETFAGSTSSWTPSLDRCLERGGRYAWSFRAKSEKKTSAWSSPSLFQVAPGPTEAEFEQAVQVVREYLASADEGRGASAGGQEQASSAAGPETVAGPDPEPIAPATTVLSVDGNVDAVTFTGDGSNLTGIRPDAPCFDATQRFVDCGNGTVTDAATGLVYLVDADCSGMLNFSAANAFAAQLKHGLCKLTDNSGAGDWRLQTKDEWEGIRKQFCFMPPGIVGNGPNSFVGCYSDNPWASDVISAIYWSSSSLVNASTYAWAIDLANGTMVSNRLKSESHYSWPVRGHRGMPGPAGPTGPTG